MWVASEHRSTVKQFLVEFFQRFVVRVFVFWIAAGSKPRASAADL